MNLKKTFSLLLLIPVFFLLTHCSSKNENSSPTSPSSEAPGASPNATNLESFAVNTFSSSGHNVRVDNATLNFGTDLSLNDKTSLEFTLSTSETLTFTLHIYCSTGSFRFKDEEEDKNTAYWPDVTLAAGEDKTFTVEFDAKRLGETSGYITITADTVSDAQIQIPLYALIPSAAEMQVIPSSYLCGSNNASTVSKVDFKSVPVGSSKTQSIKICNVGGDTFEIYSITINTDSSGEVSKIFTDERTIDEYTFTSDMINFYSGLYGIPGYFDSTIPDTLPDLSIEDSIVNQTSAFGIVDYNTQTSPQNLIIEDGDYSKLDITFTPPSSLGLESTDSQIYLAPFAASVTIATSLGDKTVTLLGASGGVEPSLAVSYSYNTVDEDGNPITNTGDVDLTSSGAAIDFGTLSKFSDWILEEGREVTVTLKNVGTKGPLKVWPAGLSSATGGFFTIKYDESLDLPIEIEAGDSKDITLIYLPTDEEVSDSPDIGQLILHHNGGNGPSNSIMLVGKQEETKAISATVDGKTLKSAYTPSKRKNLCSTDIGGTSVKTFTITNNSSKFYLIPSVSTSRFIGDGEGKTILGAKATVDTSSIPSEGIAPGSSASFTLSIQTPATVDVGTTINGKVTIKNEYVNESAYARTAQDYQVYYTAQATEDGVCTAGTANAPDGDSTLLVDRIVMVMDGLAEPLRTFPKNKLHMETYVDKENRSIVVKGITYDPATDKDKPDYKKFQPYNHQGTNPQVCFPLVDNPLAAPTDTASNNTKGYKAWNDPKTQYINTDEDFPIEEGTLCLPDKGAELETDDSGNSNYVFYHYFIKYDSSGKIVMQGKLATFYYPKETTALAQYKKMEADVGSDGSLEEYMAYEGTGGFSSYITFNEKINLPNCKYEAGTTLENDSDAIMDCWGDFKDPASGLILQRATGFVETCSYFHFEVEKGCVPQDHPTADKLREEGDPDELICTDSSITADDPDTWKGFGEYEPHVEDEEESDTKMDVTLRDVGLYGAFLSHALNDFYTNNSKLMFVELHATLTTKPIGKDHDGSADADWDDLIAPENRIYVTKDMVYKEITSTFARDNFIQDGVNGFMNVTWDGEDTQSCFDDDGNPRPMISCKGNYMITSDEKYIVMAGEPLYLEYGNRSIFTGIISFTANGEMAPSFATGGKPVYFLLSACLKDGGDLDADAGCYEEEWIDNLYPEYNIMKEYAELGIIDSASMDEEDGDPRAKIDFRPIAPRDFDQFTNYWGASDNFYLDTNFYSTGSTCGYGM